MVGYFGSFYTSKLFGKEIAKREIQHHVKVLICGMPGAGKKTLLDKIQAIVPSSQNWEFDISDLSYFEMYGRSITRPVHTYHYEGVDAVIFVIGRHRTGNSRDVGLETISSNYHLRRLMTEGKLEKCSFAVVANKQDEPNSKTVDDISKFLKAACEKVKVDFKVFETIATTGKGLSDVASWVTERIAVKGIPDSAPDEDDRVEIDEDKDFEKFGGVKPEISYLSTLVAKFKKTFLM